MASLSVRKLDESTYKQLRLLALKHRVSMEEEARRILCTAIAAPERISHVFQKYFGRQKGVELNLSHHKKPHEPMEF